MTSAFQFGFQMGKQVRFEVPDEEAATQAAESALSTTKLYPGYWGQSPAKTIRGRKRAKRVELLREHLMAAKNKVELQDLLFTAREESPRDWRKTLKAYGR